jgi:hypothetical protein
MNAQDYHRVVSLLKLYNFDIMTREEIMSGFGLVAVEDGKIVGFMWALIRGKVGIIDYLVVDADWRQKSHLGRSMIGLELSTKMFAEMMKLGVTKFIGLLDKMDGCETMLRFYQEIGMEERVPYAIVRGNPQVVKEKIENGGLNGRIRTNTKDRDRSSVSS